MIKKYYQSIALFLAVILMLSLGSCDPSKKYEKAERESIQNYLNSNSDLNFELKPSGLYYLEVLKGTGISPVVNDSAFVRYTLMYLDGTVLYSNLTEAKPYGFIIGENIYGFDEGVLLMAVGGKAKLLIPSKLAFGSQGSYVIPGYTPILYDVELLNVIPYTGK